MLNKMPLQRSTYDRYSQTVTLCTIYILVYICFIFQEGGTRLHHVLMVFAGFAGRTKMYFCTSICFVPFNQIRPIPFFGGLLSGSEKPVLSLYTLGSLCCLEVVQNMILLFYKNLSIKSYTKST